MSVWLEAIRVRQWSKNLLVFVPLVFAFKVNELTRIRPALGVFLAFCCLSSAIYLFNDIVDRDRDRRHPLKKNRPIASGRLAVPAATVAALLLGVAGFALALILTRGVLLILAAYALIQVLYITCLRDLAGPDILVIALGFTLRAVAGAVAIAVPFSPWLLVCTFFGAARVALGKRQAEIKLARSGLRLAWEKLSDGDLQAIGAVTAGTLLISYTLYCFVSHTAAVLSGGGNLAAFPPLLISLPFVYYGILRYELAAGHGEAGEPEYLLLRDGELAAAVLGWLVLTVTALYFWRP